jgi:hypothetical protein
MSARGEAAPHREAGAQACKPNAARATGAPTAPRKVERGEAAPGRNRTRLLIGIFLWLRWHGGRHRASASEPQRTVCDRRGGRFHYRSGARDRWRRIACERDDHQRSRHLPIGRNPRRAAPSRPRDGRFRSTPHRLPCSTGGLCVRSQLALCPRRRRGCGRMVSRPSRRNGPSPRGCFVTTRMGSMPAWSNTIPSRSRLLRTVSRLRRTTRHPRGRGCPSPLLRR